MNEEYETTGSLPSIVESPYVSGDIDLQSQNYSSVPANLPSIQLYKPNYDSGTKDFVESMRADTLNNLYSKTDTLTSIINGGGNKIDISGGYVKANEAYERLSDGTLLPKYEMYKPGINNEAYNASLQSNTEKILNPVQRFVTKVGRGIFADIGSFVYGVGEAAVTGRAESLFDNGMANWVDDLDKKTDFAYKNYYTDAQNGLGANLYTWDKVLGGAEFTARMLGAEAVIAVATGGASLPSSFARAGARLGLNVANDVSRLSRATRALRGIETLEDVAEIGAQASRVTRIATEPIANVARQGGGVFSAERYARGLDSAIRSGKLADNLKQARFAVTGSMYEAGFEARHYQTEAENAFWEYHRSQGTEPTQEEVANFTNKLDDTSWNVFGANMAILSVSNMALFGNMLNIKNPFPKLSTGSFFDRSIFKIGTERTAEGIWRPLKANFFNKALAYTSPIAKGAFVEGVFEEGGQGIASGMMKNYMASTYDPKAMKETADYASAFTKAFKDQYSTKEGLEEVVIGGIIGGLFGGVGGIRQTNAQYKNQEFVAQVQNAMPQVANNIVNNLYTNENLSNIFGHSNRLQGINERIEQAKAKGDVTGTALHSAESFISMLQASASVGKTDEFMTTLKESLRGMDASKIAEGQGISLESADAFKNEKIAGVESLSENYTKAREAGGYIFGRGAIGGFYEVEGNRVNRQNLIDAFAYTSAMGAVSQQVAGDSFNTFQQKLSEIGTSREISEQFGAIGALQSAGQLELTRYRQANQEETKLKKQQQSLEEQIIRTQRSEQTPETAEKLQSLANQLTDISNQIAEASSNKELYWKSIADNFYRNLGQSEGGYLPQINFDTFNNQTGNLKEFLDKSSISEFDKLELNKLLEEFNKANSAFKSFNNLANSLSSKEFTFKTYNSIFSGKRAKADESLNELTKTTLIDLYNTNTKVGETIVQNQPTPSVVTDEVLEGISTEDYQLSENVIMSLADKLKNKQVLSENEQKVYDSYKTVIDEVATEEIIDPINSQSPETNISTQTAEITVRRNEIKQLKKGIITPAVQIEIDKIDNEIKQLTEEVQRGETSIITNLDEIVREGNGRVEVEKNGEKIPFNTFDVVIDGNEAQVGHVEIGNREDYKGIGFEAYVELGTRLSQQGITLVSSYLMQGGINLWNRLLREGFAVKEGKSFRFSPKSNTDNSVELQTLGEERDQLLKEKRELNGDLNKLVKSQNTPNTSTDISVDEFARENNDGVLEYRELDFNEDTVVVYNTQQYNDWQGKGSSFRKTWNVLKFNQGTYAHVRILMTEAQKAKYNSKEKTGFSEDLRRLARENRNSNYVTLIDIRPKSDRVSRIESTVEDLNLIRAKIGTIDSRISEISAKINSLNDEKSVVENSTVKTSENLKNNDAEIQILEDSKNELVSDRIEELETEISDLKAKETLDKQIAKKKKTLAGKISLLRAQILSEIAQEGGVNTEIESTLKELIKKPYYTKVRRLRKLESQLRELNNVKEDFNPDASYRDQLEWVVNNSDVLEYENVDTLASASPPAEEDVKRFQELDSKKRLSKTEKQELSDLREKLLPYRLVEGSYFGGIPLIDIVDMYNQTLETENLESNQVERLPESAVQNTIKKVQTPETDPEFRAPDVGLVYDGVYIKGAVGNQSIHHIKLSTMFNLGLMQELPITVTEYTVNENGTETYAETQTVDFSNVNEMAKKYDNFQGVVINIGDDIVLEKSPKGVSFISRRADILPFLNYSAYAITGQPNAYNLIYEQKSDGTWSAKESEYEVTRDGIQVPFDKETLNSIKVGDEVTLFYDPNDDYNKTIKKKDRISQANIYVMKNGNLVNILKAVPTYREKNEGWVELANLRKEVIENGTAKIKVKNSYVGIPNISIDENGNAVELPINESMVESYGYLGSNGEYKFFNNVIPTDTQYTDPYKEMGKNIPIIAFNYNGKVYTFPIQVNLMGANAEAELDDILNDDSLNEYQKMFKTNSLLNKYNLDKALQWTNENNSLQAIREALTDVVSKSDITDREVVQNASKTILLDMSDPFMSAKLVFDLKSAGDILADTKNKDKDTRIEPITDVGTDLADENRC